MFNSSFSSLFLAKTYAPDHQPPAGGMESFAAELERSLLGQKKVEGTVVEGVIVSIRNDVAVVDVGLKSEGRVSVRELHSRSQLEVKVGDVISVYVERLEDKNGEVVLSLEKARREAAWDEFAKAHDEKVSVTGVITGPVKGGFAVVLNGVNGSVLAFLPGSQVDIRLIRDIEPLLRIEQLFKVLKMDKLRSNIVVSRRAVIEESRTEERSEIVAKLSEGQIMDGVVKNITDYGAFIDLGGVDGLLHVTDISWKRINHPSDVLKIGDTIKVQIIRFNPHSQRISLGVKQLAEDPWSGIDQRYFPGSRHKGKVTNIADYGAFVELEDGIEGLIHVTEMSWTKKNIHPGKIVSIGQEVEVAIIDVDVNKRRISLGLKQCMLNPWGTFSESHPAGSIIENAPIKNITEFGLFVGVSEDLDGMIHLSDISWEKSGEDVISEFKKGQLITVKVLDVDLEKERISLGIKQLSADPFEQDNVKLQKGDIVTGTITNIVDGGIEVSLMDGKLTGTIRKNELSRDRGHQSAEQRFAVGEKVDAKVLIVDRTSRKIVLSIKALEIEEEKKAMSEYGSSDSGATLGDILGAAMKKKEGEQGRS